MARERKGLRFEVLKKPVDDGFFVFDWELVGAESVTVAVSPRSFKTEREARSDVAAAKKRFKASGMVKVLTIDVDGETVLA